MQFGLVRMALRWLQLVTVRAPILLLLPFRLLECSCLVIELFGM